MARYISYNNMMAKVQIIMVTVAMVFEAVDVSQTDGKYLRSNVSRIPFSDSLYIALFSGSLRGDKLLTAKEYLRLNIPE